MFSCDSDAPGAATDGEAQVDRWPHPEDMIAAGAEISQEAGEQPDLPPKS